MNKFKAVPYIHQREGKNGWTFQVRIRTDDIEITKSFNEKDYASARIAYETAVNFKNKALVDIANNTVFRASNATVDDMFEYWEENTVVSLATKNRHRGIYERYVTTKQKKIQELTKADIIKDLNAMVDSVSKKEIQRTYSLYKNDIIETALLQDIVTKDVSIGIKVPESHKIVVKRDHSVDRETLDKIERGLLQRCNHKYESRIITYLLETLYYTGMRPCEAMALTRDDIKRDYIDVNKELGTSREEENVVRRCKTSSSIRKVPINSNLRVILDDLLEYSKFDKVFADSDGEYMVEARVSVTIGYIAKKQNVKFNMYRLRHNMATCLVTNNVDSRTTMDLLGHTSYNMSLYYASSNDELKNEAIELIS